MEWETKQKRQKHGKCKWWFSIGLILFTRGQTKMDASQTVNEQNCSFIIWLRGLQIS